MELLAEASGLQRKSDSQLFEVLGETQAVEMDTAAASHILATAASVRDTN
jgi:hypothetical protein